MMEFIFQFLASVLLRQEAETLNMAASAVSFATQEPQRVASRDRLQESIGVRTTARAFAVVDPESGKTLLAKNENEARSIASITKLMSALVFFDTNPDFETTLLIEEADHKEGSKDIFFSGEEVRLRDVFKAAFMMSNNSALATLVRSTGMTEGEFVQNMNERARAMGLFRSTFTDATGYDSGNKATALEVASIAKAAFAIPDLQEVLHSTRERVTVVNRKRSFFLLNTNHLLGSFLNAGNYTLVAGKTGTTDDAGNCLVAFVSKKGGGSVISVVLGSETGESRFSDTKALVYWVFKNFIWKL